MSLDKQSENRLKQEEQNRQKQQELHDRLAPVRVQDTYNRENLETQHKHNLEIFEKQASLTREMQEKQTKLLKNLSWRTAIATLLAAIIGAVLGMYLERSRLQSSPQLPPKQAITTTEKQNTLALPSQGEKETTKAIKPSEQEVSSLKNVSPKKERP